MPYSPFYRRRPYRLISWGVSPYTELARWVMDRYGVDYAEEAHVPLLHFLMVRQADQMPGLVVPEALLTNARGVLAYWQGRAPASESLMPDADSEIVGLIDYFYKTTAVAARRWAYYYMLADRAGTLKYWHMGAPLWEKAVSSAFFPVLKAVLVKILNLTPAAPQEAMAEIVAAFQMVEQRLSDGRRYLMGDRLTAADIAFASLVGPAILPAGYGGPLPTIDEVPAEMREGVARLRDTVAGRFVIRLYAEDRDRAADRRSTPRVGFGVAALLRQIGSAIAGSPRVLRLVFSILRRWKPIFLRRGLAVVTWHADVVDVLERDEDFTIAEINDARMTAAYAPFILGWDRSPRYDREVGILRRAIGPPDLIAIRAIVSRQAAALIGAAPVARRIDVISGLSRVVPMRVLAEFFGTPGPNEQTMMRWMRLLFEEMFLNRANDPAVSRVAASYAIELRDYLTSLIVQRKGELNGNRDDVLTRLLRMQAEPGESLDDDGVRRNISGLIVGAVDTTSAAVAQAIDQLLDRPKELARAGAAARANDVDLVSKYVFEALRFNPQSTGLLRYCGRGATIAPGSPREARVPPGSTVLLATLSAMFDPRAVAGPDEFRIDRDASNYLHFGHGMHVCFGRAINLIQIPEIATALLKLDGLRRASGLKGRIAYDGPFPDRCVVEFNA